MLDLRLLHQAIRVGVLVPNVVDANFNDFVDLLFVLVIVEFVI